MNIDVPVVDLTSSEQCFAEIACSDTSAKRTDAAVRALNALTAEMQAYQRRGADFLQALSRDFEAKDQQLREFKRQTLETFDRNIAKSDQVARTEVLAANEEHATKIRNFQEHIRSLYARCAGIIALNPPLERAETLLSSSPTVAQGPPLDIAIPDYSWERIVGAYEDAARVHENLTAGQQGKYVARLLQFTPGRSLGFSAPRPELSPPLNDAATPLEKMMVGHSFWFSQYAGVCVALTALAVATMAVLTMMAKNPNHITAATILSTAVMLYIYYLRARRSSRFGMSRLQDGLGRLHSTVLTDALAQMAQIKENANVHLDAVAIGVAAWFADREIEVERKKEMIEQTRKKSIESLRQQRTQFDAQINLELEAQKHNYNASLADTESELAWQVTLARRLASDVSDSLREITSKPEAAGVDFDQDVATVADPASERGVPVHFRIGSYGRHGLALTELATSAASQDIAMEVGAPVIEELRVPVFWACDNRKALLVTDQEPAETFFREAATALFCRMLRQVPAGKIKFTLIDPIGLGRSFADSLKLGDYDETLISSKVWSDKEHVKRRLKDLMEHIETVTQKYLRNDYENIEAYNASAEEIAEPYRVLLIADLSDAVDEEIFRDLVRVVQNGPRCGVFVCVHYNEKKPLPYGVSLDVLRPFSIELERSVGRSCRVAVQQASGILPEPKSAVTEEPALHFEFDAPPTQKLVAEIVDAFGKGAQSAKRVEVPYPSIFRQRKAKDGQSIWWGENSTHGLAIPMGPSGATRIEEIVFGRGTSHSALVVGRPGSGKSNLLHVVITALARLYSPVEVELYLIDFKKGVEFKQYADHRLPHARVIAIESEREFGINILSALDKELARRGEIFRSIGANSVGEYRAKRSEALPRILLVVDEFQEFFSKEDKIKREAALLFDRLVRQGRAFGIHLILATQSLANAGLERSTQDQMAIRIALQCSESDSRLILADDNLAARRLSRPGEAIYNDAAGLVEGNKPFQVALFSEADRDRELSATRAKADAEGYGHLDLVIFEGHEPARISGCRPLWRALSGAEQIWRGSSAWIGEPVSLSPPVSLSFARSAGHNALILSRDEDVAAGLACATIVGMIATSADAIRFGVVDLSSSEGRWPNTFTRLSALTPEGIPIVGRRDMANLIEGCAREVSRRTESGAIGQPEFFVFIIGLHRARDLRPSDNDFPSLAMGDPSKQDKSPRENLAVILRDGPEVGIHVVMTCDTFANLERIVERSVLREIGFRMSGPLSAQDSQRLFDDQVAAGIDKPHRMVLYEDDKVGVFQLFRPYVLDEETLRLVEEIKGASMSGRSPMTTS